MLSKQQKIILVAAGVFVIIVVAVGLLFREKTAEEKSAAQKNSQPRTSNLQPPASNLQPAYSPEVPKDAKPTEPTQTIKLDANPENKQGIFQIEATANGYSPASIVVKSGDIVTLKFTSKGGDYDFHSPAYGTYISAKDGETKEVSFKPTTVGTFLIQCRDACPPDKKITGQLIVIP